jgi:hypothetical protein
MPWPPSHVGGSEVDCLATKLVTHSVHGFRELAVAVRFRSLCPVGKKPELALSPVLIEPAKRDSNKTCWPPPRPMQFIEKGPRDVGDSAV